MTNLKAYRLDSGETMCSLAQRIGLNQTQLSTYENGLMRVPEKWRSPIAELLGVPEEELFDARGFAKEIAKGE